MFSCVRAERGQPLHEARSAEPVLSIFLPRNAMHKRGICHHAVSVCVSVCLSVCHVRELRQNE